MRRDKIELYRRRSPERPFGLRIRAANGELWQSGQGYTRKGAAKRIGERFALRHGFGFVDLTLADEAVSLLRRLNTALKSEDTAALAAVEADAARSARRLKDGAR